MRIYTSTQHRFFDHLVVFLGSLCGLSMGIGLQRFGKQVPIEQENNIIIQGRANVSGVEFIFYPYNLMQALANNSWPETLEIHESSLVSDPKIMGFQRAGLRGISATLIQSAFVHYFEASLPDVEAKYGRNKQSWPSIWNFGRIVRNAFAHGGTIHFTNNKAKPVKWKTLCYAPEQNGRQIVFQDLTPVEIIILMEELDVAV